MAPGSHFITALDGADVGATRYTILAGGIAVNQSDNNAFLGGPMTKITRMVQIDLVFDHSA